MSNSTTMKVPEGHQPVMAYLIVHSASAFQDFMTQVFGAIEKTKTMRDQDAIMHAEIRVGESTIMFADSTDQYGVQTGGFFIYVSNADETFAKAIEHGAVEVLPLSDMPYGRSGGVKDPFGNTWWITSVTD